MDISQRFIRQARDYGQLEKQLDRDYTEIVKAIALDETIRLIDGGVPHEEAFAQVNAVLANEVKRFPVILENEIE